MLTAKKWPPLITIQSTANHKPLLQSVECAVHWNSLLNYFSKVEKLHLA